MARGPAGAAADRPSVFECFQEGMRNERIVGGGVGIGAGVPGLRRDVGDTAADSIFAAPRLRSSHSTLSADLDIVAQTTGSTATMSRHRLTFRCRRCRLPARDTVETEDREILRLITLKIGASAQLAAAARCLGVLHVH